MAEATLERFNRNKGEGNVPRSLDQLIQKRSPAMQVQKNDRPKVELRLNADGLTVTWGPEGGPWGIYAENAPLEKVKVKEWWLYVGTKANSEQSDEPDEPFRCESVSKSVGTTTEMILPRKLLPLKKQVLAQVIGYFDSKDERGNPIEEGIYSDVARQVIT
jgi:hypothetical protein